MPPQLNDINGYKIAIATFTDVEIRFDVVVADTDPFLNITEDFLKLCYDLCRH